MFNGDSLIRGRGVLLTTHRLLVLRSWKSRATDIPPHRACNGITLPFLYVYNHHIMITTILPVTLGSYSVLSIVIRLWTKRPNDRGFITWQG